MTTQDKGTRAELLRQAIKLKRTVARSQSPGPQRPPGEGQTEQHLGWGPIAPRPQGQEAHLGELQRSLWLQHQLEPTSPAYNLTSAFRVTGDLDAAELQRSLNTVVSRHRLLRSTFSAQRGNVLQIVHPASEIAIELIEAGDGQALEIAAREARKPFDLESGPLIRLLLVEDPTGKDRLLVLVLHHILADERSLGFLWNEFVESYSGRLPKETRLPQYDDYVHWLSTQAPQQRDEELAIWRRRLDPLPENLRLPFENPPGKRNTAGGRLLSRPLASDVGRHIRRLASTTDTTPFVVLAFAFRLLLHRLTDGRNIAFATPVSRRSHPDTAQMIGYFLNPMVVSILIDEARSVQHALDDFGRQMKELLAQASVPFDTLVEELSPPRQRDRHPIFQTLFVYQETPPAPVLGAARLEPLTQDLGESKFDLTLFVSKGLPSTGTQSWEIAIEYRSDRFDELWMRNLLDQYETLIGQLAKELGSPISGVSILPPEESKKLRSNARGASTDFENSALLPQQILDQAQRSKRAPAVISGEEEWSYADLEHSAHRIAAELTRYGAQPGDRVGLFLDRTPLMIAGVLGSHWAGTAYVPLDPAYPPARNYDILEDAEVAAVLTRAALSDQLPKGAWPTIDIDRLETQDGSESSTLPRASTLAETGTDQPAYLLYTSGSMGRPKGVVVTHGNLRASNEARLQVYGTPSSRHQGTGQAHRFLLLPSIAFDSSVAGLFWMLATGGALVIPSEDETRDPRRLVQLMVERQVTGLLCVPSLYAHLLTVDGDRLRGLEIAIVAGESCPQQLVEEHFRLLPQTRLFNEYGPTEASVWATVHEIERQDSKRSAAVPIGRPIPGVRVEVLDAQGRCVPTGVPGEGWISGPTVAQGYWRQPELTAERFFDRQIDVEPDVGRPERRYRSGDRLSWTVDGQLLFLGRVDEQIKVRGFRIEPGEIEAALLEIPEIEMAAVVARDSGQLVAFVETAGTVPKDAGSKDAVPKDAGSKDAVSGVADLSRRQKLAERLPDFMVPSRIVEIRELPRLPNGKVDRKQLREMPLRPATGERESNTEGTAEPNLPILSDRDQALVSLWQGLLGRSGIGLADNFFLLGGHSLLVVEMTSAIERDFGVTLTPAEVFQNPTIEEIARRIDQEDGPRHPSYAHLFPIQPGGRQAPFLFCVPHFFSEMVANRFRGERPVYGLRGVSLRQEGNRGRWRTMRDLGEELVQEIGRRFPGDPCIMAGYSFGATMAVEAVRLMEERGLPVQRLILIAPMPVDVYRAGPFRMQLDGLRQPIQELSFRQALQHFAQRNHPLTRRLYQRARRHLVTQPWRRLLCAVGKLRLAAGLPLTPKILHADVRLERFRLHANYRPGILHTPTVVFNAKEPETDAAATWRPYFKGPFTVHPTPDPHLDEASVQATKKLILDHLSDLGAP